MFFKCKKDKEISRLKFSTIKFEVLLYWNFICVVVLFGPNSLMKVSLQSVHYKFGVVLSLLMLQHFFLYEHGIHFLICLHLILKIGSERGQ